MKAGKISQLLWSLFACTALITSCKEFIEPSIKGSQVNLQAPGNNYASTSYSMNFWWDNVNDALYYRLQVVSPKFDSIGALIIDTLVKKNTFTLTLNPGNYQWHVRAENGSSQTAYSAPRSLSVLFSSIKQQTLQLSAPGNNTLTNQSAISFQWQSMYGATKYRLEIDTNNFVNESTVIYNQLVPGLQVNYSFPKDQSYQWRVRAENDTAQSKWSNINVISYNHTPPGIVTLISPTNKQTVSLPVSLQWNNVGKATKYKVYILKSDSTTLYNQTFPTSITNNTFQFNSGTSGEKAYWKISAVDAYGNEGQASILRSFVVQ